MAEDNTIEGEEGSRLRLKATQAEHTAEQEPARQSEEDPQDVPPSLLGDARLRGRANSTVQSGLMRQLQRTYGNRAVQRAVQRAVDSQRDDDLSRRIQAQEGTGSSLDGGVQHKLEQGLGADLSGVRVHTGPQAGELAESVQAVAFTSGQDIFFREGAYDPGTTRGLELLAHEAVHTVQQATGSVPGTPGPGGVSISHPSDSFEQAAETAAGRVQAGLPAGQLVPGMAAPTNVQREEDAGTAAEPEEQQRKKPDEEGASTS